MNKLAIALVATVFNGAMVMNGFAGELTKFACAAGPVSSSGVIGKIIQSSGDVLYSGAAGYTEAKPGAKLVSTVRPNLQAHLLFNQKSEDWICSTGFAVLRCVEEKSNAGYVFQHLFGHCIVQQIDMLITGSNYPAINSRDVRSLEIPTPLVEKQTAIAEVLSDMDADLAALEAQRDKAKEIKQGMMQELLTGKVRLI